MDTINVDTLSVEQLESLAYRLVEQQNNINNNLTIVQQELAKKRAAPADTKDGKNKEE